jgi:predicted secreted hydrolase
MKKLLKFINLKKIFVISIFFVFISNYSITACNSNSINNFYCKDFQEFHLGFLNNLKLQYSYEPTNIDLKDASYHKSYNKISEEWWYFDAIFDNKYSIAISIVIFSKNIYGIGSIGIDVYNNTNLEYHIEKQFYIKDFLASEEYPKIIVSGKKILELDKDLFNKTGKWVYNLSLEIENKIVMLKFIGTSLGYKGIVLGGWYGPVLPKAIVEGYIILDNHSINVSGIGYHEHAWGISHPIKVFGWLWNKLSTDNFTISWGIMMQTRFTEHIRVAVFSIDNNSYINIDPDNINIKTQGYIFDNWRFIPTKFSLNIKDPTNLIYINVTMDALNTQHFGKWGINYWRYHLRVNGEISYGLYTEKIEDKIQIMEYMKFR